MKKISKKKQIVLPRPFHQGRDLYESSGRLDYKVYIEAALHAARADDIPLQDVKTYIKGHMIPDHVLQELGYETDKLPGV